MNAPDDLQRLSRGDDRELADLLGSAKEDGPSPEAQAALLAVLAAATVAGTAASTAATTTATTASTATAAKTLAVPLFAKWVVGLGLLATVGGAGMYLQKTRARAVPVTTAPVTVTAPAVAPSPPVTTILPAPTAPAAPVAPAAPSMRRVAPLVAPTATAPVATAPTTATAPAETATAPVVTAPTPTPATIRDETARIARVRSLLDGGNAAEAAAELDRYVAAYPKGFFAADVTRLRSEIAAKR